MASAPPVHVVIPTHTPAYLGTALAALAHQTLKPASITVSCDTDDEAIGAEIQKWVERFGLSVWWVRRPHMNEERLCQVRNNAVRHIAHTYGETGSRVLVIDRDMVLPPGTLAGHAEVGAKAPLVYAYRIDVNEERSNALTPAGIFDGSQMPTPSAEERAALEKRDRRYRKHALMQRLRLGPPHKPKLLGGHFSVSIEAYLALNGFDELYRGWGFKDDEFAHRAARSGYRAAVAVARLPAFHLYHPTRQPDRPMRELPNAQRFAQQHKLPLVCENGLRSPLDQPKVAADSIHTPTTSP